MPHRPSFDADAPQANTTLRDSPPQAPIALLFDLDGTLVDSIELIMQSMEFAFSDFSGARPTREEWLLGLGIPLREQLAQRARSAEELDWMIARYRLYQGEHHDRMTVPFAGVGETLAALHTAGHPIGLVTSKFHAGAWRALTHVKFEHYFGAIIGCDSVTHGKPHPEPVHKALAELRADPPRALFVGDSPHDIAAGNAAGVGTVAATWGPFSREQLAAARPTHWLDDFRDLPSLIGTLG